MVIVLVACFAISSQAAEVARVGNESISVEAVRQAIARNGHNIYEASSARKATEEVIQFELLAAEAKRLGYDKDPAIAQQFKQLLVQRIVAERIDMPLKGQAFTDDELKAYYDAHLDEFTKPAMARGGVMTFFLTEGKGDEASRKANAALAELKNGERFEVATKKHSDDPSERITGGAGTWLVQSQPSRRYPAEVVETMHRLVKPGEFAGPIATTKALYIVSLTEKRPGEVTAFDQAKKEIRNRLAHARREVAYSAFCEGLKTNFPVTINESELKKAVESTQPNAGPPLGPVSLPR